MQMDCGGAASNINNRHNRRKVVFRSLGIRRHRKHQRMQHDKHPCRVLRAHFHRPNAKTPALSGGGFWLEGSLTITYFHTGIRTIIGVESFHGPVRDGKGWDRLAMVIRQRGLLRCFAAQPILEEAVILSCVYHTRESNLSLWIAASAFTRRRSIRQTCYRIKPYGQLVSVS